MAEWQALPDVGALGSAMDGKQQTKRRAVSEL